MAPLPLGMVAFLRSFRLTLYDTYDMRDPLFEICVNLLMMLFTG
jgi:hypothetical protein